MPKRSSTWTSNKSGWREYAVNDLGQDDFGTDVTVMLVPVSAIADRMTIYGLSSEEEAIDHIMWEHFIRMNPDSSPDSLPDDVRANFERVHGLEQKAVRGFELTSEEKVEQDDRAAALRAPEAIAEEQPKSESAAPSEESYFPSDEEGDAAYGE